MNSKFLLASALCTLLLPAAAGAQQAQAPGDIAAGRDIALRSCASCHAVSGGPAVTTDTAPTFVAIARDPKRDRSNVAAWLMDPHGPMPNFQLSVREITDLTAYINSLKATP